MLSPLCYYQTQAITTVINARQADMLHTKCQQFDLLTKTVRGLTELTSEDGLRKYTWSIVKTVTLCKLN